MNQDLTWHKSTISRKKREKLKDQKAKVLFFTGLSGSGKSTIANELELLFYNNNFHTYLLDGDNLRHGLNQDLGFSNKDRSQNIRRVAEVAKLFLDAGIITICSFIAPFKKDRELARQIIGDDFLEIYINTSFEICQSRDPKKLYQKANNQKIKNFTGLESNYEVPTNPELIITTTNKTATQNALEIYDFFKIF